MEDNMQFLFAIILAFIVTYLGRKVIKRYAVLFYIAAVIISVGIICFDFKDLPFWINTYIIGLFSRGVFATALWCVVMWTGAFPNGSKMIKAFMPIRGELSILAALLTLGHNIGYGKTYFIWLFTDLERMSRSQFLASILTLAMLAIMIPLTVLSFPRIRRSINAKLWKKIQRFAYLFYGMLYLHIMILCIPLARVGRSGYPFRIFIYNMIFVGYAVCRVRKWVILRKGVSEKKVLNRVCAGVFVLLVGLVIAFSEPERLQTEKEVEGNAGMWQLQAFEEESSLNQETESAYKDGIYTASAFGYDGDIEVTLTIEGGVITEIMGISYEGDTWYYESARDVIFMQILSEQNCEADVVSGATYSSKAIMEAVKKALKEAEGQ